MDERLAALNPSLLAEGWKLQEVLFEEGPVVITRCTTPLPLFPTAIAKMLKSGTSSAVVAALRAEGEALALLRHCPNVVRSIGFTESPHACLFAEDHRATNLTVFMKDTYKNLFSLQEKVDIAVYVCRGVNAAHKAGILHMNIGPGAVAVNMRAHRVVVGGFHHAVRLPLPPGVVFRGWPAYMAPEHSGRLPTTMDFRSDLYSLGMLLFVLFAETLPFPFPPTSVDWIPVHMAKIIPPAAETSPSLVPPLISDMIRLLLQKDKAARYQSAHGLEHDLTRFQDEMAAGADPFTIRFPLQLHDRAASLSVPSALIGREEEMATLMRLFMDTLQGNEHIVYMASPSGMGKTALVEQFRRKACAHNSNVIWLSAKAEPSRRNTPFAGVIRVFESFAEAITSKGVQYLTEIQQLLLAAMPPASVAALVWLVPEMERVLGPALAPQEPRGEDRQRLVIQAISSLMDVMNHPDRPIVMVIEDLHYLDKESFDISTHMIDQRKKRYFLNLSLFRTDELSDNDVLTGYLAHHKKNNSQATEVMQLRSLSTKHVNELVASMLNTEPPRCADLAALIADNGRSPFHCSALMQTLLAEGLIEYSYDTHQFSYDVNRIAARLKPDDDVADVIAARLAHMPREVTCMLARAACIGRNFDLTTLCHVCAGVTTSQVKAWLGLAVEHRILSGGAPMVQQPFLSTASGGANDDLYQFQHARLMEICLAQHPELAVETHLALARHVLAGIGVSTAADLVQRRYLTQSVISDAANHFAVALAAAADENSAPAVLDNETLILIVRVALAAIDANIHESRPNASVGSPSAPVPATYGAGDSSRNTARAHLRTAQNALGRLARSRGGDAWLGDHALAYAVHKALVELDGDDRHVEEALAHVTCTEEQVDLLMTRARALIREYKMDASTAYSRRALDALGYAFPPPQETTAALTSLADEMDRQLESIDLEAAFSKALVMDDSTSTIALVAEVLYDFVTASYFVNPELMTLVGARAIEYGLKHGFHRHLLFPTTLYGNHLILRGKPELAMRLGDLAVLAEERMGVAKNSTETYLAARTMSAHFIRPLRELPATFSDCFKEMRKLRGTLFSAGAVTNYCRARVLIGSSFSLWIDSEVMREMVGSSLANVHIAGTGVLRSTLRIVFEMMHGSRWFAALSHSYPTVVQPNARVSVLQTSTEEFGATLHDPWSRSWFYTMLGLHMLVIGCHKEAFDAIMMAKLDWRREHVDQTAILGNLILACAAGQLLRSQPDAILPAETETIRKALSLAVSQLDHVRRMGPDNFTCFYMLARASELAAVEGPSLDTLSMYDECVTLASAARHHHIIALAHRGTANVWRQKGGAMALRYAGIEDELANAAFAEWGLLTNAPRSPSESPSLPLAQVSPEVIAISAVPPAVMAGGRYEEKSPAAQARESASSIHLDTVSILRAARAISSELHLPKLLEKLMQILMEAVGAQAVAILRPSGNSEYILDAATSMETTGSAESSRLPPILSLARDTILRPDDAPLSLLNACVAAGVPIAVADARTDPRCASDPHVVRHQPVSFLCAPLLSRGRLLRVVFVQNNLVPGAFAARRLAVFEGLASQAATSIENAFLYTQLEGEKALLESARDAAVKANSAKSEFLAMISHEIRTPMNGIMSMVALLRATNIAAEYREHLDIMNTSGEILLHLIESVLDFSSLESGRFEIKSAPLSINNCLAACAKLVGPAAAAKGLEVKVIEGRVPVQVTGDAVRLRQIAINLLTNAIKYTEKGSVTLSYSGDDLIAKDKDGQFELHMVVVDTGVGISKENILRLFKPFTQVDSSSKRRVEGVGLGLAITQTLATRMGGRVWVESTPGKGSQFHCTLLFTMDSSQALDQDALTLARSPRQTRKQLSPLMPTVNAPAKPGDLKILIVDDNAINQRVLSKLLTRLEFTNVAVASTGREAVAMAHSAEESFDVILMDVFMPEMDGLEATEAIRALPIARQPVIVAVTASAMEGDRERFLQHGMNDYLSKPISMDALNAMLRAIMRNRVSGDGAGAPLFRVCSS